MLNTSKSKLARKFNLHGKKRGMSFGEGGTIKKTASDSTTTKKPNTDYYDTDISKSKVKAHKPDYYDTDISTTEIKAHLESHSNPRTIGKAHGGVIEGAGSTRSDSILSKIKKNSFVVPAEHAVMAQMLRQDMLQDDTGKADLNQSGGANVRVSNGEHLFTPSESKILHRKLKNPTGINMLAPNSDKKFKLNNLLNHGNSKRTKK